MFGNKAERHGEGEVKNTKGYYLNLLGMNRTPEMPSEMPRELVLPAEIFGDIEYAILEANRDGLERSQVVMYDAKSRRLRCTRIFVGNSSTTSAEEARESLVRAYFGSKPLLSHHIHPRGIWYFSSHDVASFRAFPRGSYIDCVGSSVGIVAMLQTRTSSKIPFGVSSEFKKTLKFLQGNEFIKKGNGEMAKLIESLGFGYYYWVPERGEVVSGDIKGKLLFARARY